MATKQSSGIFVKKTTRKRPKIHSKKKTSKIKTSKLYKKVNVGQG